MRKQITLYDDQYEFYKTIRRTKSVGLLVAFVEYMFEDIEPKGLTKSEETAFKSLRIRMDNQKKKSDAGSIKTKTKVVENYTVKSSNDNSELESKKIKSDIKTKSNTISKQEQDKDILSKDNILEDKEEKEIYKEKIYEEFLREFSPGTQLGDKYFFHYPQVGLDAVKDWLEYKQGTPKKSYKTYKGFKTQLVGFLSKLGQQTKTGADIPIRLRYAVDRASYKWDGLRWTKEMEEGYESWKKDWKAENLPKKEEEITNEQLEQLKNILPIPI